MRHVEIFLAKQQGQLGFTLVQHHHNADQPTKTPLSAQMRCCTARQRSYLNAPCRDLSREAAGTVGLHPRAAPSQCRPTDQNSSFRTNEMLHSTSEIVPECAMSRSFSRSSRDSWASPSCSTITMPTNRPKLLFPHK